MLPPNNVNATFALCLFVFCCCCITTSLSLHHVRSDGHRTCQHSGYQVRQDEQYSLLFELTAFCRYWGKRDTALILPTNSSLSVTLDQDHLRSTTTSRADESFTGPDRLWLNGKEEVIKMGGRMSVCIRELKAWRKEMEDKDSSLIKVGVSPIRSPSCRR